MNEVIKLKKNKATLRCTEPAAAGERISIDVKLPKGILLRSFTLSGTVTGCACGGNNGSGDYVLEMEIGDLCQTDRKILYAYIDFLEREKVLDSIKIDVDTLQAVFADFGEKLRALHARTEALKSNVNGILAMAARDREGKKTTIH